MERRNFAHPSSKYPRLEGLVNLQSLKRLRADSGFRKILARAEKPPRPASDARLLEVK
jgi:hypothetical protein